MPSTTNAAQLTIALDVNRTHKNKTGYDASPYDFNCSFATETHTTETFLRDVVAQGWPYTMAHAKRTPKETGADARNVKTPKHGENFTSIQVITGDDDRGQAGILDFWRRDPFFARWGFALVESVNSKPDAQKCHPVWVLDTPVTDYELARECLRALWDKKHGRYPFMDSSIDPTNTIYNADDGEKIHELGNILPWEVFEREVLTPYRERLEQEQPVVPPVGNGGEVDVLRKSRYWQQALQSAADVIRAARDGEKHAELLKASRLLGGYIAGGMGSEGDARALLVAEIRNKGGVKDLSLAEQTIDNGLMYGAGVPISYDAKEGERAEWMRLHGRGDDAPPADKTAPPAPSPPKVFTLPEIMDMLAEIRTEQATFWMKQNCDDPPPQPDTKKNTWLVINKCGALTEIEMQAVIAEVEREPSLLKKSRAIILKLWAKAQRTLSRIIKPKATDDIIADAYKKTFENQRMFTRSRWYKWLDTGVWSDECEAKDEIWQQMIAMKDADVTPTSNKRRSVEEYLQGGSMMGVPETAVDARPDLLNLANGALDIVTGEMSPNSFDFYLTTQLPFNFDQDAECPRWLEFLDQVLVDRDGKPCRDTIHFMQQAFGYSLTAWTKYEVSFWLQGDGANGKSTLLRILAQVNGSAAMSLNLGMLERDMYQLANLSGVRVVMCSESPVGLKVADAVIKGLVSGDPMQVRLPYAKPFQLYPICKVWWAMNNPPRVADTSEGFWRRVKVVPFRAAFGRNGGKPADVNLVSKLKEELPGILNWALEGLRDLETEGWVASSSITEATDAYRESNDVERAFIEACCVEGSACKVGGKQLYDAYKDWCVETGHRYKSMTRIASDWVRIGFEKKRTGNGVWYYGVGLLSERLPEIPM